MDYNEIEGGSNHLIDTFEAVILPRPDRYSPNIGGVLNFSLQVKRSNVLWASRTSLVQV